MRDWLTRAQYHPNAKMPPAQQYTIESWTGDQVGLVKYVMKGSGENVLVSFEAK